jgi:hypothetical protein
MCSAFYKPALNFKKNKQMELDIEIFDKYGKALHIADVISRFKIQLEVNAGRLAEPLLKQGKQPKEDKECHKAFLMLAHLSEIEDYVNVL